MQAIPGSDVALKSAVTINFQAGEDMTDLARPLGTIVFTAALGRGFRAGMVLLLALVLHACATTDPRLTTALKRTSVAEIRVETAPDVRMGGLFYQGKPDPRLPTVTRTLETAMRKELIGLPGGPVRGRLVVTLHVVNVSSDAGRVLIGTDSSIDGIVRLENAATGELIAQSRSIRAQDRGMKGGGLGVTVRCRQCGHRRRTAGRAAHPPVGGQATA